MKKFGIQLTTCVLAMLFSLSLAAQDSPAPSPMGKVYQRVGVTDVEIQYSRPGVKGRAIFGSESSLQPNGKLWRTGANAATTISFSTDVMVGGQKVAAGKYSVFSIPGAEWSFMLNSDADQRGTRNYDKAKDVATLKLTPTEYPANVETMTFVFTNVKDTSMDLIMLWEKTMLTIPITVEKTW